MESKQNNQNMILMNQGQDKNKGTDIENGLEDQGRGKGKLRQSERVA